ncbi:MAG: hypothetical protein H7Z37_12620 [Pyrinomonadaceae bacterium]|nr:hypothetical protein [Pyrinomonadaceae bacterium]
MIKNINLNRVLRFATIAFLAMIIFGTTFEAMAQTRRRPVVRRKTTPRRTVARTPAIRYYAVNTGEVIRVRMEREISSKTARIGDTFTTKTVEPVYSSDGVVVIPVGSTITGRVETATRARNGGNPGQIGFNFTRIRLPNGRTKVINGSLTSLDSGKTTSDDEGNATARKTGNRKLIYIGGGGAGGAVLGGLIGGGKGALIGGLLGAGGGFLGERYTKGVDAVVKSGTEFGVLLNQSISLPKFAEGGN